MENQEIVFRSSSLKLRQGFDDKATLSWIVISAKSVELEVPQVGVLSLSNHGEYIVQPKATTQYKLVAKFPDGSEQVKHLSIEVLPPSQVSFDVVELKDENSVHAELRWNFTNATDIKLNGEKIKKSGFKKFLITERIKPTFEYTDAFGTKQKTIIIEPANSLKYKATRAIYAIAKIIVRPFTFIGSSSPGEYFLTTCILAISFIITIGNLLYQHHWDFGCLKQDENALTVFKWFSIYFYLWLMAHAKRRKDGGKSPWVILWPLLLLFLLSIIYYALINFNILTDGNRQIYLVFTIIFLLFWYICEYFAPAINLESHFDLTKEFVPDFLLAKTKEGYKIKEIMVFL